MTWDIHDADAKDADLCAALADMSPANARAQKAIVAHIEANFEAEGNPTDGAWPDLAPSTLADRARKGFPPGPILYRTGDLRAASSNHAEHGADFAEAGVSDHAYAKYHFDRESPRSKIPLRDAIPTDEDDALADEIENEIESHLARHHG